MERKSKSRRVFKSIPLFQLYREGEGEETGRKVVLLQSLCMSKPDRALTLVKQKHLSPSLSFFLSLSFSLRLVWIVCLICLLSCSVCHSGHLYPGRWKKSMEKKPGKIEGGIKPLIALALFSRPALPSTHITLCTNLHVSSPHFFLHSRRPPSPVLLCSQSQPKREDKSHETRTKVNLDKMKRRTWENPSVFLNRILA